MPFLELIADASAGLAFIIVLMLIAGRRDNASLCLRGAVVYLKLALLCWPAGLLAYALSYFGQVWHYGNALGGMLAPLLAPAGRPWLTAFLAWTAAGACMGCALWALAGKNPEPPGNRYAIIYVRRPLWGCILASLCFYASLCLANWPFAGLPSGLSMDKAAMLILRHNLHKYIMDFCPAGAFALVATIFMIAGEPARRWTLAIRWPAIWAAAGALPSILQNWGVLLGLGAGGRLQGAMAQGLWIPSLGLGCLAMAAFVWGWIIWKPDSWRNWGLAAFGLLLLKTASPLLAALMLTSV